MPKSELRESFEEQYAFDSAYTSLLSAVKGKHPLITPEDQVAAADTTYHAIANTYKKQSDLFEQILGGKGDAVACEYVCLKLKQRFADKTIPVSTGPTESQLDVLARMAARHLSNRQSQPSNDFKEMVQIDIKQVTCFMDGERRRFVAHFDAVNVSL